MKVMRIVMVVPFAYNCYQWKMALTPEIEKTLNISVDFIETFPSTFKNYNRKSKYWDKIRNADGVFVYTTLDTESFWYKPDNWWKLSYKIKEYMRKDAKMVVQFDDDLLWVFYPESRWWDRLEKPAKDPKEFFEKSRLLKVADAYIKGAEKIPFEDYTSKPVFQLFLPHLTYYQVDERWTKPCIKNSQIAVLQHSAHASSSDDTLENLIKPKNLPVSLFLVKNEIHPHKRMTLQECAEYGYHHQLPKGSDVFSLLEQKVYMDFLSQNFVAIDDNTNYLGWSRFAMECAIANTPCIGSTQGVRMLFPDLYTELHNYEKQFELILKFQKDKKFYEYVVNKAYNSVKRLFDNETLYRKLAEIFTKIGTPETFEKKESKISPSSPPPEPVKLKQPEGRQGPHP